MKSHEIRQAFIDYFKRQGHTAVHSSRLIPEDDPTLLFCNAGMNQFKNTFLGLEERDYKRAVSSQKCVRAGGKHNDLENVGQTARHHTFFEMLGNFSFGDYFKKDAIKFAWEFLTVDLKIPKDKLYVTVFETDDEAAEIWHNQEGVPKDRILRFGEDDNFWRMGNTGPCGPSSEIFYDFGEEVGGDPKENVINGDGDRFVEIWNLVFMQFNEDENGNKAPLPKPSIDTGAGLERLCTVMQGKLNNYDTDVFQSIIQKACDISEVKYTEDTSSLKGGDLEAANSINTSLRVLADHARSAAFLISDGVLPSNEGRGYVLRRIMRRAIRYGRNLTEKSLFPSVVEAVIDNMSNHYTELNERRSIVVKNVKDEEERFLKTLDQGTQLLNEELKELKANKQTTLSGETVFKLYDTYGFPTDLTRLMAEEQGLNVDEKSFEKHMSEAKQLAKASWKGAGLDSDQAHVIQLSADVSSENGPTDFEGYFGTIVSEGNIIRLSDGNQVVDELSEGQTGLVIFDKTCFYGESGGQVGDTGHIESAHGKAEVLSTLKQNDIHLLQVRITEGKLTRGDQCSQKVTSAIRNATACNHSGTHLLHAALKNVLGEHVQQAGSLVDEKRLRFDFTHNSPLTTEEIDKIEDMVNTEITKAKSVETDIMTPNEAKEKGALALFGEKYGDQVRVVSMGPFSMELCGGTHVNNTGEIGVLKIVSESGVSSGVRRIEALTGPMARDYLMKQTRELIRINNKAGITQNWSDTMKSDSFATVEYFEKQREKVKSLEKEIQSLKSSSTNIDDFLNSATDFESNGAKGKLILADIPVDDRKVLSDLSDKLRDKASPAVVVVIGKGDKTSPLIVTVSKDISKAVNAGKILKEVATVMGGKGGGRPDFAQGSAPDRSKVSEAFEKAKTILNS